MTAILQRPRERVPRSVHYRDEETCETDPLRWSAAAPPPWAAALAAGSLSPPSPQLKDLTASLLSILKQLHDAGYFTLPVPLSSPPLSLSLDVEDTLPIIANAALYEDVEFMVCHHLYPGRAPEPPAAHVSEGFPHKATSLRFHLLPPDIKSFVGHMRRLLATAWRLDLTSAPKVKHRQIHRQQYYPDDGDFRTLAPRSWHFSKIV